MSTPKRILTIAAITGLGAGAVSRLRRQAARAGDASVHVVDPAHAPGKRHRGPAPTAADPATGSGAANRNQPWVRTSHSDSQQRRFRR